MGQTIPVLAAARLDIYAVAVYILDKPESIQLYFFKSRIDVRRKNWLCVSVFYQYFY